MHSQVKSSCALPGFTLLYCVVTLPSRACSAEPAGAVLPQHRGGHVCVRHRPLAAASPAAVTPQELHESILCHAAEAGQLPHLCTRLRQVVNHSGVVGKLIGLVIQRLSSPVKASFG